MENENKNLVFEPEAVYGAADDNKILYFIRLIREGIRFPNFKSFAKLIPFSLSEWSKYLHISERTMQRYEKEARTFDPLQSEKILEILLLHQKGTEVFGSPERFNNWLAIENIALGNIKPKSLLDSSFGINMIKDELGRIEHGIPS